MHELFLKGGPLMYPLLICSLIAFTITIERIIFWMREKKHCDSEKLTRSLSTVWQQDISNKKTMKLSTTGKSIIVTSCVKILALISPSAHPTTEISGSGSHE